MSSAATEIFVVTGANKGIGYGIVRGLAAKVVGGLIYLTARNPPLGDEAVKNLLLELGDKRRSEVAFHQLDITNEESCRTFAEHLKNKHGQIGVVINNAGFAFKNNATESAGVQADETIKVNYYGTKLASKYLAPLIRDGGRLVNVCSMMGMMDPKFYAPEFIAKFKSSNFTIQDVDEFAEKYKKSAYANTRKQDGFPESAYRVSKVAEIALTLIQHKELSGRNIKVNACCPGYVDTDMTSHKGALTIDQGAETPIFLATDPMAPNGKFVKDKKIVEWIQA